MLLLPVVVVVVEWGISGERASLQRRGKKRIKASSVGGGRAI